jgi:hypothetical protein
MIDGAQQRDRFLPALKEGYFNVDELRFEQLVAMSARLASKLAFYDSNNKTEFDPDGPDSENVDETSWAGLFNNDEALLLAQIVSRDPEPNRAVALHGTNNDRSKAIDDLGADFKRWGEALASTDYGRPVSKRIRRLESEATRYEKDKRAQLLFLVAGLKTIRQFALAQLAHSLKSRSHDPAVGLLIAFLQLYQGTQDQINRFTDRHVDFYYQDCLHFQPKAGVPESVHLLCERDAATPEVAVQRGTKFIAPKGPDGSEAVYIAEDEVIVSDANVGALAELRMEHDPLISPEHELNYVTRANQTWFDVNDQETHPASGDLQTIFTGAKREGSSPAAEDALIGLAIASPALFLAEGKRDIRITLWLDDSAEVDHDAIEKINQHKTGGAGRLTDVFDRYIKLQKHLLGQEESSNEHLADELVHAAVNLAFHLADQFEHAKQTLAEATSFAEELAGKAKSFSKQEALAEQQEYQTATLVDKLKLTSNALPHKLEHAAETLVAAKRRAKSLADQVAVLPHKLVDEATLLGRALDLADELASEVKGLIQEDALAKNLERQAKPLVVKLEHAAKTLTTATARVETLPSEMKVLVEEVGRLADSLVREVRKLIDKLGPVEGLLQKLRDKEKPGVEGYFGEAKAVATMLAVEAKPRLYTKDVHPGSYFDVFLTQVFLHKARKAQAADQESMLPQKISAQVQLRAGKLFSRWLLTKWDPQFDWLNKEELKEVRRRWAELSQSREGDKLNLDNPWGRFEFDSGKARRYLRRKPPTQYEGKGPEALERESDRSLDLLSLFHDNSKPPQREAIFTKLLNRIFEVSLTTSTGWHEAKNALVVRAQPRAGRPRSGLEILVSLKPDVAPIVGYTPELHGGSWQTSLPVARIHLRPDAGFYPYSLFDDLILNAIDISVDVEGVRNVVLANDLGMLDPSKPFPPFGPLPRIGSYFVVGSPEVACKNPTSLQINAEWGGLPQESGGFRKYYEGYDSAFDGNCIFQAAVSVLQDGSWQPQGTNGQAIPLFGEETSGKIVNQSSVEVSGRVLRNHFRNTGATLSEDGPELALDAANGLVRLLLIGPSFAFGHAEYPAVLSRTAQQSLGRKFKRKVRVPNSPYTPVIQKITIDYRAETSIQLNGEPRRRSNAAGEKVFHLHPFGSDQIFPGGKVNPPLLPRYDSGGNLFIGLRGTNLKGKLTLLFHLKDRGALRRNASERRLEWAYLSDNEWEILEPKRILSDTTWGFVTPGIVTLDLPNDVTDDNTILPAGFFWLRVSDRTSFDTFANIYSVKAQALKAIRDDSTPETAFSRHGTPMVPVSALPGLLGVMQIGDAFGGRSAESRESMRARVGERLRHKNRAQTPWDYERLVLERFPQVKKAKCFMSTRSRSDAREAIMLAEQPGGAKMRQADDTVPPGEVIVVVLPDLPTAPVFDSGFAPGLNRLELDRIKEYLQSVMPQTARITVSNPVYERIQVRCALDLASGHPTGDSVELIEQTIIEAISPWHDSGYNTLRFDWSIQAEELEGLIEKLDCVESVRKLTLLQIVSDDEDLHVLNVVDGQEAIRVKAMLPGSIPIPTDWHIIELNDESSENTVKNTGIEHMKLGDTFIIGWLRDETTA